MVDDEHDGLLIRRTSRDDVPAIVALASRSLGWAGDQRDHDFFVWKHFENPFGESPGWAAFDGERMVAIRMMMRWEFQRGSEALRMVRAVDTATDPDYQGRGLFRRLTMLAAEQLTGEGVDAIFNTPNEQSRPGYIRMGWKELGRPALWVQPRSLNTLRRMSRSRVAAEKWSLPVSIGELAANFQDLQFGDGWRTPRSREFLNWRYGFVPLNYRVVEVSGGVAVIRVRMRGVLREIAVCEWLSPIPDPGSVRRIVQTSGDYAVGVGLSAKHGFINLPKQGPRVTWRPLASDRVQDLGQMSLRLGDVELL